MIEEERVREGEDVAEVIPVWGCVVRWRTSGLRR